MERATLAPWRFWALRVSYLLPHSDQRRMFSTDAGRQARFLAATHKHNQTPGAAPALVISEFLAAPGNATSPLPAAAAPGATSAAASEDWVELFNPGPGAANLGGWKLAAGGDDKKKEEEWELPAIELAPGGYLVLIGSKNGGAGKDSQVVSGAGGISLLPIRGLKLGKGGKPLSLLRPDGSEAGGTGEVVRQQSGVTFGIPSGAPPAAPGGRPLYTFLASPTPGGTNSAAKPSGPFIYSLKRSSPKGQTPPGADIVIAARVAPNGSPVKSVDLIYKVNYSPDNKIPMAPTQAGPDAAGKPGTVYSATIPPMVFKQGDMVRWAVVATAAGSGLVTREPAPGAGEGSYKGTVIAAVSEGNTTVPVMYWFTEDPVAAQSQAGARGSLALGGAFYDEVHSQRRGMTSLSWAKPKLKFAATKDNKFDLFPNAPEQKELKLNSLYHELGENSFMKEVVATKVMSEEGLMAPLDYHIAVHLNGAFEGLYGLVEEVDNELIDRFGLPLGGPIFKSVSGELSNLRWDLPIQEMPNYYGKANRKKDGQDWWLLRNLTLGLAGGGPVTRSRYLFDALDLPSVINEMAIQSLLNNMDRCTKNFYVWLNPQTMTWRTIPWDLEASMGQDNNLGGSPGPLYCILACEQWSSPLYCDSEHPQDLEVKTAWGTTTVVGMNTYFGPARGGASSEGGNVAMPPAASGRQRLQGGRQLMQGGGAPGAARLQAEGNKRFAFPSPKGWDNPDRVTVGTPSPNGAEGTYNHLIDAVLDVAATRAMYMRRLRTLADKYYGPDPAKGRLRQIIDETWAKIKDVAALDNAKWGRGDGTRGYAQLTTEFIPIRAKQLLQVYAPGGQRPLLPGPQDDSQAKISVSKAEASGPEGEHYIQVTSGASPGDSLDVSGWGFTRGNAEWTFPPGTVLLGGTSAYLSPDLPAFRARGASPRGGEGLLVLQAPRELVAQPAGAAWSVTAPGGARVAQGGA